MFTPTTCSQSTIFAVYGMLCVLDVQVFEYLTTDLKKYMDRNGKGPNYPLPKPTIKVRATKHEPCCQG